MNEEYNKSLIRKLVSNARAIITEEVGLSIGCSKMLKILNTLEPYERVKIAKINVFEKYDERTQYIPSGTARLYCSKEAFQRYDTDLQFVGQRLKPQILEVCFEIIDKYGDKKNRLNL